MIIDYEGVILKPWSYSDAPALALVANNKRVTDNLRDGLPNPYYEKDALDWLGIVIPGNDPTRFFSITVENRIVGSIGIVEKDNIYRKNCEIGYFLAEDQWGKGIMTKAIKAATRHAFNTFDIVRLYAEPFADNAGSRRALEKAGFIHEATLKNYVIKNGIIKDSCIYRMLKEEFRN
ncbi:MAG TPA: GNAT family protein [Bacteroidales bacterium]|nr:GNAT family protein [Bacteroidales bacterium]